jgi:hypothetical protein
MAYRAAKKCNHSAKFWAFDSFQGMPHQQGPKDNHPKWVHQRMATSLEEFHRLCNVNRISKNDYRVVPGFYNSTLPVFPPTHEPRDVALAFIDCDLYSSTKLALDFLTPRIKHGMIISFHDYFCWSSTQISGERRAMLEFSKSNKDWNFEPYIQFGWHGQSFVVEAL